MVSEITKDNKRKDYILKYCKYMLSKFLTDQQVIDSLVNSYFDEGLQKSEFNQGVNYTRDDLQEIATDISDWILLLHDGIQKMSKIYYSL